MVSLLLNLLGDCLGILGELDLDEDFDFLKTKRCWGVEMTRYSEVLLQPIFNERKYVILSWKLIAKVTLDRIATAIEDVVHIFSRDNIIFPSIYLATRALQLVCFDGHIALGQSTQARARLFTNVTMYRILQTTFSGFLGYMEKIKNPFPGKK